MRKLVIVLGLMAIVLAISIPAFAGPKDLVFYGNKVDRGLAVKNTGQETVHLFILIESMGCNGSMVPTGNGKYKLEMGTGLTDPKDYFHMKNGKTVFSNSYWWKLSHYNHYVLHAGDKAIIQSAPCHGSVTYQKIGRAWTFTNEQWAWFRANCLEANPNCGWAK